MKFSKRNIVFGFVFLLGMLLSFSIYLQHHTISLNLELTAENDSTSGCISPDSELHEEDQVTCKIEFQSVVEIINQADHFQVTRRLSQPFFAVWQPPKIS